LVVGQVASSIAAAAVLGAGEAEMDGSRG
jgi:hypothetical protein